MKSIIGIKDIDREILMKMSDKELLKTCSLNNYFKNEVCDDMFLKRRLQSTYPDTLKYKPNQDSWRNYFLYMIYCIFKMKEAYNYIYVSGDPEIQWLNFFASKGNNDVLLISSSYEGVMEGVMEALKRGADIHYMNDFSLIKASEKGYMQIVKYLIENGANIHAIYDSALQLAAYKGHLEIVKYLIENGANIHASDDEALKLAVKGDHLEIVKYLVEQGADAYANDNEVFEIAEINNHEDILDYLLSQF